MSISQSSVTSVTQVKKKVKKNGWLKPVHIAQKNNKKMIFADCSDFDAFLKYFDLGSKWEKKKSGICTALIRALWSAVLAQSTGNRDDSPSRKCLIVEISPQHVSAVAHSVTLPHTTHPV